MRQALHFGPGNFFRAHMAEYLFDAGGWGITAVALRSGEFRDQWAAQSGAYTLAVQGAAPRRIDVIHAVLVAPEGPQEVLNRITAPETEVISATVTEKGYHLRPDGSLDLETPAIRAELDSGMPATLIGYLAHGLARRSAPVMVLSCDNRTGNGEALERAVREFAKAARLDITCDARFPNAMVDRITPATTDALRAETGDPLAVSCEPFKEWVIEDRFATLPRPDWPGVIWVADVAPYEMRKLRMLNGAHSLLAYAGSRAGHTFVHEAVADPTLRALARTLMQEAAETLPNTVRGTAEAYAAALLERFDNPHIAHALRQIAMDGSQKLPYRMVETLRDRTDRPSPALIAGLRAWIAFCRAETAAGHALQDAQAGQIARARTDADFMAILAAEDLTSRLSE